MIKTVISKMAELYEDGYSIPEIAKKFCISERWVRENLKGWYGKEL